MNQVEAFFENITEGLSGTITWAVKYPLEAAAIVLAAVGCQFFAWLFVAIPR